MATKKEGRQKKNPLPNLKNYSREYAKFSWSQQHANFSFHRGGPVNYAYEVTDRQVAKGHGKKPAIVSQKPDGKIETITFGELADRSTTLASHLQKHGLKPGDRFGIYAPRSIEYSIVLFAAIKCGAIVVPLFEAFGKDAIADRLNDCSATWLYTTKRLMPNVDLKKIRAIEHLLVDEEVEAPRRKVHILADFLRESLPFKLHSGNLETPFIIHYTSGSTGKPKGILLVNRAMIGHLVTAKYVLDLHPEDKYWNTGDPGWVTGMVYNFFAPLLLGVTAHIYEGPFQPKEWAAFMSRMKISVWYSTPTAFRLLRYYEASINTKNTPALRHIVSAGEPLNPSLIDWTMQNLGIPIHDSWYMTENGHQLINNYRALPIRKGSMGKPLPGIYAAIIDEQGEEVPDGTKGRLAVRTPWPGLMKTVWNNPKRFEQYFQNEWYISGDTAYKDNDGYFWFQGREDDIIKSAAERISPFEIESALVAHPKVAEAGVIGKPHDLYGNIVKAFVMVKPGVEADAALKTDIVRFIREQLSAHEVPREIEFVKKLPKTRSGKIMRRVLRAREMGQEMGDLSTLDAEMNPEKDPPHLKT